MIKAICNLFEYLLSVMCEPFAGSIPTSVEEPYQVEAAGTTQGMHNVPQNLAMVPPWVQVLQHFEKRSVIEPLAYLCATISSLEEDYAITEEIANAMSEEIRIILGGDYHFLTTYAMHRFGRNVCARDKAAPFRIEWLKDHIAHHAGVLL